MQTRARRAALTLVTTLAVTSMGATSALADGNASHSVRFNQGAEGLGMTSVGVGLSGRRIGAVPAVPVTEGALPLAGVPAGAQIIAAYLYWVVYGSVGDDKVEFGVVPTSLTGSLIGTSAHTCWPEFDQTELNRVYRADVTARVTGNANFLIRAFPSGTATADTQGASLVVIYDDPADSNFGDVILNDGAITGPAAPVMGTFAAVASTAHTLSAWFRLGAGDGQAGLSDGALTFSGTPLTQPAGGHWSNSAGTYWDDRAYDVTSLIDPAETNIPWERYDGSDCVVYAYAGLSISSVFIDDDGDGTVNDRDNCKDIANADQLNSDGDIHGDACDNCVDDNNTPQTDTDGDGVGSICDNCIDTPNPAQAHSDADTWGDACDNCPTITNQYQDDNDGDGIGTACEGLSEGGAGGGGSANSGGADSGGTTASSGGSDGETGGTTASSGGSDGGETTSETSGGGEGPSATGGAVGVDVGGGGDGGDSHDRGRVSTDSGCGCGVVGAPGVRATLLAFGALGFALLGLRRRRYSP